MTGEVYVYLEDSVKEQIVSIDESLKKIASITEKNFLAVEQWRAEQRKEPEEITDKQYNYLVTLLSNKGMTFGECIPMLSKTEAKHLITKLQTMKGKK